jgi:hypothetical protein
MPGHVQRSPELETARRDVSATQAEWSSLALLEIVVIRTEQKKLKQVEIH